MSGISATPSEDRKENMNLIVKEADLLAQRGNVKETKQLRENQEPI